MNDRIQELINENYEVKLREKEAELMALNLQLNHHFLYNTLNVINWMALDEGQESISKMIGSLSVMLQYAVRNKEELIAFQDDLTWLKSYIHIMENRYLGKFKVEYELEDIPLNAKTPKMFMQPFVENAIIHGFAYKSEGGCIRISGKIVEETLIFTIRDNGLGMDEGTVKAILQGSTKGVGIMNVQTRVKLLFGESYGVSIQSWPERVSKITITLPICT
jgi:two-component system sensor histidine kinase YesM